MRGPAELADGLTGRGAGDDSRLMREKGRMLTRQPAQSLGLWRIDHDPPVLHEDDAVAALQRKGRPLLGDHDRAAERRREVEQRLRSLGVELRGRLVEQEEPRTESERRCNTDSLELAGGELVGLPAGEMLGAHPPERLEGANRDLERRHAEVLEAELELVLDAGHHDLVLGVLEDGRDRPGQVARPCRPRVAAPDLDPPGEPAAVEVRHQAGERAQQRRLSRP